MSHIFAQNVYASHTSVEYSSLFCSVAPLLFPCFMGRPGGAGVPSSLHNLKVVGSNLDGTLAVLDVLSV